MTEHVTGSTGDAPAPSQLDHAALVVASLDRATAFYSRLLDLTVLDRVPLSDHTIQYLAAGQGVRLELISYLEPVSAAAPRSPDVPEPHHLAWRVADPAQYQQRALDLGAIGVSPPVCMPELGQTSLLIRDLDGYLVELVKR